MFESDTTSEDMVKLKSKIARIRSEFREFYPFYSLTAIHTCVCTSSSYIYALSPDFVCTVVNNIIVDTCDNYYTIVSILSAIWRNTCKCLPGQGLLQPDKAMDMTWI